MTAERSVLISGASTGIGRACALHLDRLGWRVFAGVRRQADADSLQAEASSRLTTVHLDVTDVRSVHAAQELVAGSIADGLSGLVNNAGIPYGGPIEFLDLDEVRRLFEVNFFGLIAVTQAFIPLLRLGRGRIVNMSSISGLVATPFLSPYSTSKFALEALSDALRVELHPWNIQVVVIEAGVIDTPIWNKGIEIMRHVLERAPQEGIQRYGGLLGTMEIRLRPAGIPPVHVARVVARALTAAHPRARYQVGPGAGAVTILRLFPESWRDWLILSRLPRWG